MKVLTSVGDRISRHRAVQLRQGFRQVVLSLPNTIDPGYQTRLAEECRRLARLTPDEDALTAGFARLAGRTEGWR